MNPLDYILATFGFIPPNLDETMLDFYQERAAILEFDAGLPKEKAEALALAELETYIRGSK